MNTNLIMITGNLIKDSELKTTANDKMLLKFCVANNVGFGDHKSTNFFNATLWGTRAEKLQQYLTKGKKVLITGSMNSNKKDDRTFWDINVREIELLGGNNSGASSTTESYSGGDDSDIPF